MQPLEPITLVGRWVKLEPLALAHLSGLAAVSDAEEIWRYLRADLRRPSDLEAWISAALEEQRAGAELPFAIIEQSSGKQVGSTRFFTTWWKDKGLEIGSTWLTPSVWRSPINSESKYLLLEYAFEKLDCIRVQLVTDVRNERSQRAIERLGAKREGVIRQHMIMRDGFRRDSVLYSILDSEWPVVKENLARKTYQWP